MQGRTKNQNAGVSQLCGYLCSLCRVVVDTFGLPLRLNEVSTIVLRFLMKLNNARTTASAASFTLTSNNLVHFSTRFTPCLQVLLGPIDVATSVCDLTIVSDSPQKPERENLPYTSADPPLSLFEIFSDLSSRLEWHL